MTLKVQIEPNQAEVKAIIGAWGNGIFFRMNNNESIYIDQEGEASIVKLSWQDLIKDKERTPILSGETIKITL